MENVYEVFNFWMRIGYEKFLGYGSGFTKLISAHLFIGSLLAFSMAKAGCIRHASYAFFERMRLIS